MKIWDGSAWTDRPAKYWNGSAWVACPPKFWTGSAWSSGGAAAPIVPPAFRAVWNTSYGSGRSSTDIDKPTGTVQNDIMIASVFLGKSGGVITEDVAPPDGTWTQIGSKTNVQQATTFYGQFAAWWKRAGASEPLFYSFTTSASYSTQGVIQSISGCPTSGSPIDAVNQNQVNSQPGGNIFPIAGVTTTQANDLLLWHIHNWDAAGNLSPPTGMTERLDHLTYCADKVVAAAGATGSVDQVQASNLPAAGYLIALKGT